MSRAIPVLLAALALALAACGGDDAGGAADTTTTTASAGPSAGPAAPPAEGVAASVNGTEIDAATVEAIYDDLAGAPEMAPQLEGEQGEQLRPLLRAQILTQLVVQETVLQGAEEDHGITVTDADLQTTLDELAAQVGGEEAFDAQLATVGLTRERFVTLELPLTVVLRRLSETYGIDEEAASAEDPSEEQLALQAWVFERFAATDVRVDEAYGTWNPETGEIEPT